MRYKGYAVTYAGEKLEVNKKNFFLNGMYREKFDDPNFFATNKDFRRRNLYAVSGATKCDDAAEELALLAVDILKEFSGEDFLENCREYFDYANSAIGSNILERENEHFEVDTTVLHIQSDVATVFSMGDVQAFYFEKNKIRKMSGEPPKMVEIEKGSFDEEGVFQTEMIERKNIPYLGHLSEDCATEPFISESIKLRHKSFFVLCSKAVSDAIGEKEIERILSDKRVKNKDKALKIMESAIEKKSGDNYTVLVVEARKGLSITDAEFRSLSIWLAITALCGAIYLASPYIIRAVLNTVESGRELIEEYRERDENEGDVELRWTPKVIEKDSEDEEAEEEAEKEVEEEVETPKTPVTRPNSRPVKNNTQSGDSSKVTEKPAESTIPSQVTPGPGESEEQTGEQTNENENPPEKTDDVELPIDFN